MTDDELPEAEDDRLMAVPITDDFAQVAAQVLREYREMVEGSITHLGPDAASPFMTEVAAINSTPEPLGSARGSLHAMLLEIAGLSFDTAVDNVKALEHDIVRNPPPVWSPLVLARAVLESCLFFDYLFDPSISGALRLARCAGLWHKDTDHSSNLAKILEQDEEAEDLRAYVRKALAECNIVARTSTSGKITGYIVDGEVSNLDFVITERAKSSLPSWLPMPYGLLSGAAHSRPWMTNRARTMSKDGSGLVGEAATVMTAIMVAMASMEMCLRIFQGYFGYELDAALAELEEYREFMFLRLIGLAHATE
ncbi:hypothetical protein PV749_13925 [Streptomyces sp. ID03-2B]|uniref:hypothetical protein n=1 Tax=Streptomyces sp. ID03-2B TaxID=3028660 RepID=UPI0029A188C7|nr:hypothetical protein [Streptomyces sp. ID03-2B]MDX3592213.1 hypothetical protein [Streptomyces sp. ID03-2B]